MPKRKFSTELQEVNSFLRKEPSNEYAAFCTHSKSEISVAHRGNRYIQNKIFYYIKQTKQVGNNNNNKRVKYLLMSSNSDLSIIY